MSYSHARELDNVWSRLRNKFRLVLVLDQGKYDLHRTVRAKGYTVKEFFCKNKKFYFFHVNSEQNLCERGRHRVRSWEQRCWKRVTMDCDAGLHSQDMKCYEWQEYGALPCTVPVDIELQCGHFTMVQCDKAHRRHRKCTVPVDIKLQCGHSTMVQCDKVRSQQHQCTQVVTRTCAAGLHSVVVLCSKTQLEPCLRRVARKISCFRLRSVRCFEMHPEETAAAESVPKKLHNKCRDKVRIRLLCGHVLATTRIQLGQSAPSQYSNDPPLLVTLLERPSAAEDGGLRCVERCTEMLLCGHKCEADCAECYCGRIHAECKSQCTRQRMCGHRCGGRCHGAEGGPRKCRGSCIRGCIRSKLRSLTQTKCRHGRKGSWASLQKSLSLHSDLDLMWPHLYPVVSLMNHSRLDRHLLDVSEPLHDFVLQLTAIFQDARLNCPFKQHFLSQLCVEFLAKLHLPNKTLDADKVAQIHQELTRLSAAATLLQTSADNDQQKAVELFNLLQNRSH